MSPIWADSVTEHVYTSLARSGRSGPDTESSEITALGAVGAAAYAAREGMDIGAFVERAGPAMTTKQVGKAIADLAASPGRDGGAYLLTAAGLAPLQ